MSHERRAGAYLLLISAAFAGVVGWTWGRWPDPIVDFGRELYVPWQLSEGKVLYRDVAHFNGPFSQYLNALLFKTLGVSLRTLVLANTAIAAGVTVMIWRLARAMVGRLGAATAALVFVLMFMALQLVPIGNYNWITPYSHELTHGIALSLAAMVALMRFIARPRPRTAGLVGLLLGLVFLTKPEVFAAAAPACVVGLVFGARSRAAPVSTALLAGGLGVLVPPVVSVSLLWLAMPLAEALRGTLGGWEYVFDGRLSALAFYRRSMGMDQLMVNLALAGKQLACYTAVFGGALLVDRAVRRQSRRLRTGAAVVYALAVVAALLVIEASIGWHDAFRGIFPAMVLMLLFAIGSVVRVGSPKSVLRLAVMVFATLLLAKLALAIRVYHYGFALVMPAFVALVACGAGGWKRAWTLRVATIAVTGVIVSVHLRAYSNAFRDKPVRVAPGTADEFSADPAGRVVNDVVTVLSNAAPEASVAVVPQGAMINYLSGRANPTPYIVLMPPEVLMYGDEKVRDAYAAHPPDLLFIVATDYREYGYNSFDEYAPRTAQWMRDNYSPVDGPLPDQVRLFMRRGNLR